MMHNDFYKSIFSFCLCKDGAISADCLTEYDCNHQIGAFRLYTDERTPYDYADNDGRELVIFGYAVDVFNGQSQNLAKCIVEQAESFEDVIEYEKKLGGKYVIFFAEGEKCCVLGDATCSAPVFYSYEMPSFFCCSNPEFAVKAFNLKPDAYLQKIRNSGNINQAMPYDKTVYKELRQLIPNHYVDSVTGKAVRFVNSYTRQKTVTPQQAAEITAPMIEKTTEYYLSQFKIYCPLTSGRDSRVVYAFLKSLTNDVKSYTVWQERFEKDDQDWTVPPQIASLCSTEHKQIREDVPTDEEKSVMDSIAGVNGYPQDAFALSVTVINNFPGYTTIEGDIIGQVGKCSLHRNIPGILATPAYFRCKLHNYSDEAKSELKMWIKEIKSSGEKVNLFDLFSIENRLGVWASHTHLIRNIMGQPFVNIFNSRSIIYVWTAVDRAKRMNSEIHIELIKLKMPELLQVPFEKEKKGIIVLAKSSASAFYLGSFAKYYIAKRSFVSGR